MNIQFYSNPLPNLAGFDFRLQQLHVVSFDKKSFCKSLDHFELIAVIDKHMIDCLCTFSCKKHFSLKRLP